MATKSGQIKSLINKAVNTKYGSKLVHSVVLEDGTEIETGFKQPYRVGEHFNREVEYKFRTWRDIGPAVAGSPEAVTTGPTRAVGPVPASGRTFPVNQDSPEMSIIRQNALTNARELVVAAYKMSAGTITDMDKFLEGTCDQILRTAYKFADFSSGQREVKRAQEMARTNPETC